MARQHLDKVNDLKTDLTSHENMKIRAIWENKAPHKKCSGALSTTLTPPTLCQNKQSPPRKAVHEHLKEEEEDRSQSLNEKRSLLADRRMELSNKARAIQQEKDQERQDRVMGAYDDQLARDSNELRAHILNKRAAEVKTQIQSQIMERRLVTLADEQAQAELLQMQNIERNRQEEEYVERSNTLKASRAQWVSYLDKQLDEIQNSRAMERIVSKEQESAILAELERIKAHSETQQKMELEAYRAEAIETNNQAIYWKKKKLELQELQNNVDKEMLASSLRKEEEQKRLERSVRMEKIMQAQAYYDQLASEAENKGTKIDDASQMDLWKIVNEDMNAEMVARKTMQDEFGKAQQYNREQMEQRKQNDEQLRKQMLLKEKQELKERTQALMKADIQQKKETLAQEVHHKLVLETQQVAKGLYNRSVKAQDKHILQTFADNENHRNAKIQSIIERYH